MERLKLAAIVWEGAFHNVVVEGSLWCSRPRKIRAAYGPPPSRVPHGPGLGRSAGEGLAASCRSSPRRRARRRFGRLDRHGWAQRSRIATRHDRKPRRAITALKGRLRARWSLGQAGEPLGRNDVDALDLPRHEQTGIHGTASPFIRTRHDPRRRSGKGLRLGYRRRSTIMSSALTAVSSRPGLC